VLSVPCLFANAIAERSSVCELAWAGMSPITVATATGTATDMAIRGFMDESFRRSEERRICH
jgi:hypothetical protein